MGGVPEPLGTRGEAGLSCSLATHPHHSPVSLRFPFSISTPSDHHQQAQKRRGVSEPLTHRPQSSVHLHKGVEGWAGLCPASLREEWQWEEETHTNPVFHLLDEQACHCQDGHTGVSAGVGLPPGGKGQAQGPDPKQGALGGQCGSDGQASGSVAQLLPPSTASSMVGTWLDPMQDFWEPTPFPSFRMRLASLRVIWPGSHLGGPAYLPQVQLQHLGPRRAELEGEGTAVWEDCLRWGSRAGAPFKTAESLLSCKVGYVGETFSFSRCSASSRAPAGSRARARASSGARGSSSCSSTVRAGAGGGLTTSSLTSSSLTSIGLSRAGASAISFSPSASF